MIQLDGLTTGYGDKVVSRSLEAMLPEGRLVCLLGANGAGKSTLMKTLAGFLKPIGGQVLIDGQALAAMTPRQLARKVGVVLTERVEVADMTVHELVAMGRQPYTGFWGGLTPTDEDAVCQAIRQVGIEALEGRMVHSLSDGERQKVMIAKALAQGTPMILLDEPTAFLDFPSKVEVMRLLLRLAHGHGKTIFLSTHDVELAMQTTDLLWLLYGEALVQGTPRALADDGVLERFFSVPGVKFDRDTLRFTIYKSSQSQV